MGAAEVDAALAEDDQCAATGEEAALCHLNALQLKADKLAQESSAEEAEGEGEGNACTTGLVGQIHAFAAPCLDACSHACGALGQAINAYMTKGGQPAAMHVICHYKRQFSCALTGANLPKCKGLIDKAAGFGFKLPSSMRELHGSCH
eukprot:SRR837773.4475.p3 GENE.SRR837773.4475~~SRR837773.4475.p3  ORF type:complete len:163 (+),score=72.40 SRR837773.4475:48-491(+)